MVDPQQELFSQVKIDLKTQGHGVYDGVLPSPDTPYPFYYLGDCRQIDEANKSAVFGTVYLTIHVWHNKTTQRGTVSQMLAAAKHICRSIDHTKHFGWSLRNVNQTIMPDDTTNTPLLHGVLEVELKFS